MNDNLDILGVNESIREIIISIDLKFERYHKMMDYIHSNKYSREMIRNSKIVFSPVNSQESSFMKSFSDFEKSFYYVKLREFFAGSLLLEKQPKILLLNGRVNEHINNPHVGILVSFITFKFVNLKQKPKLMSSLRKFVFDHMTSHNPVYSIPKHNIRIFST